MAPVSKTLMFKTFCIERYKFAHKMKGTEVMRLFSEYGVLDYLGSFYDVPHTFGERYIVEDIDEFIRVRQNGN